MKTLYLDIFSGISGDMFIGAMIDLGVPFEWIESELKKLGLNGYSLKVMRGEKSSISGTKFDVLLEGDEVLGYSHASGGSPAPHREPDPHPSPLPSDGRGSRERSSVDGRHAQSLGLGVSHPGPLPEEREPEAAEHSHPVEHGHEHHGHSHEHEHGHSHGHGPGHSHSHTHKTDAFGFLSFSAGGSEMHHHEHHHDHDHTHGRNFADIRKLIIASTLSSWVKQKAIGVFTRIAIAEGKIHGQPPEAVHFHEVGAVDSIVDIVGACIALEKLGKPRVLAAEVTEGTGWIRCAHGRFPIPAPATLNILAQREIPISQCDEPNELVTPTGAALLAEFVEEFGPLKNFRPEKIGFGLGQRNNRTRPNVLRALFGTASPLSADAEDWDSDTIAVIETNLDDINAEVLGYAVEKCFALGALDVFHTPIQMKKNRPGVLLTVLCAAEARDRFMKLLLTETTAFGVRYHLTERRKLRREIITVQTAFGEVEIKIGKLGAKIVQQAPEFESCRQAAERANVPIKEIYQAALHKLREGSR